MLIINTFHGELVSLQLTIFTSSRNGATLAAMLAVSGNCVFGQPDKCKSNIFHFCFLELFLQKKQQAALSRISVRSCCVRINREKD